MILLTLLKGEFQRLVKYKILYAGIAVSLMWVGITAIISKAEVNSTLPLLIFTDAGMMSVLLLAAMMYFEKQEGTLRTTFITPVKIWQLIFAKISASVVIGLISAFLISLAAVVIHGAQINILLLLFYTAIIVTANCSLGFLFIFISKDFNTMLINYMIYIMIFFIPSILLMLGIIPKSLEDIMLISPVFVSQTLINSTFFAVEGYMIVISLLYLIAMPVLFLLFYVGKKLKNFSIGG